MGETDNEEKQMSAWLVCLIAVAAACLLWWGWSQYGVRYAHRWITAQATAVQATRTDATQSPPAQSPSEPEKALAEMAQVGDTYGGLNSLLTAIAGALVFWAGFMQHRALKDAQRREREDRDATSRALDIARDANDIATQSRRDAVRPWLKIAPAVTTVAGSDEGTIRVIVELSITNKGGGPAVRVRPSVDYVALPGRLIHRVDPSGERDQLEHYPKNLNQFSERIDETEPTALRILPGETITTSHLLVFHLDDVAMENSRFSLVHVGIGAHYSPIYETPERFKLCDLYALNERDELPVRSATLTQGSQTRGEVVLEPAGLGEGVFS